MISHGQAAAINVAALLLPLAALACLCAGEPQPIRQENTSIVNKQTSVSNSEETINISNELNNNYHIREANYRPTQSTQVVFNVGKLGKKLRKARPPTTDELAVKRRLISVYNEALREAQQAEGGKVHLQHLGRILKALNPKYIATERVFRTVFSDPADPNLEVIPPELEGAEGSSEGEMADEDKIELGKEGPVAQQLDRVADRFEQLVKWDQQFSSALADTPISQLSPRQIAFKTLFQCLAEPNSCQTKPTDRFEPKEQRRNREPAWAASSGLESSNTGGPWRWTSQLSPLRQQRMRAPLWKQSMPSVQPKPIVRRRFSDSFN